MIMKWWLLMMILMVPISLLVLMINMEISLLGNIAAAAKHIPSQVLALSAVECTTVAIHLLMLFAPLMIW